jgi:hypothetical protein
MAKKRCFLLQPTPRVNPARESFDTQPRPDHVGLSFDDLRAFRHGIRGAGLSDVRRRAILARLCEGESFFSRAAWLGRNCAVAAQQLVCRSD